VVLQNLLLHLHQLRHCLVECEELRGDFLFLSIFKHKPFIIKCMVYSI